MQKEPWEALCRDENSDLFQKARTRKTQSFQLKACTLKHVAFYAVLPGGADVRAAGQNAVGRQFRVWAACHLPKCELWVENIALCSLECSLLWSSDVGAWHHLSPMGPVLSILPSTPGFADSQKLSGKHSSSPSSLYCLSYDCFLPREKGRARTFSGTAHGEVGGSLNSVEFAS